MHIHIVTPAWSDHTELKELILSIADGLEIKITIQVLTNDGLVRLNNAYDKPAIFVDCLPFIYEDDFPTSDELTECFQRRMNRPTAKKETDKSPN